MKLLDEIIDLLADENSSLNAALLKTKVLLHTIGHAELAEWVNDELNGYAEGKPVPKYRILGTRVVGNIANSRLFQQNADLPTHHLPKNLKDQLDNRELREAMSVLQGMAIAKTNSSLRIPLSPEIGAEIDQGLSGYYVQKCWLEMHPTQVQHAISQVRSRLLDFALNLRDKIGVADDQEVKAVVATTDISKMFHGAVFGDNATVVVGNENKVKVSIRRGDVNELARLLIDKGVSDSDVAELKTAITDDEGKVDVATKSFGPNVKTWISRMMGKVVESSWQIELGIAGNLLTDALKGYYF